MQNIQINLPLVSIVIPHFGASEILYSCFDSLVHTTYRQFEIILVDNGSDLDPEGLDRWPIPIRHVKNPRNLGFAGGCNVGIRGAKGKYIVLLNNDTLVEPDWLEPLVAVMEQEPTLAACQPRLLSSRFQGKLDYAGAMGGLIDLFGYPFALGRVFDTTESDDGNFPGRYPIFWASGTASIWRKELLDQFGYLDEDLFAHMEEIDLSWRCHLQGFQIQSLSSSRVYHFSGYSLRHDSWRKMYLNHRNNLIILLKNLESTTLLWLFPLRLMMELLTVVIALLSLDWKRLIAILFALTYIVFHIRPIWLKRKRIQAMRIIPDGDIFKQMFRGSIVWHYFVLKHKSVRQFMEIRALE